MVKVSQVSSLIKQELKRARRSRYVIFAFVLLPIFMWGLQGGIQLLITGSLSNIVGGDGSDETLFITTGLSDPEELTNLSRPFILPFDFENMDNGTLVTEIKLNKFLIASLEYASETNNTPFTKVLIQTNLSFTEVQELSETGEVEFWLHIPAEFNNFYTTNNTTKVELNFLSTGLLSSTIFEARLGVILGQAPFTIIDTTKIATIDVNPILIGGEETGLNFGVGFAGFLGILVAVLAPAPFVSTSFAGEREKKTMEALLALPISRRTILLGKLAAGLILVGILVIANIVGMFLYNFLLSLSSQSEISDAINDSGFGAIDLNLITIVSISIAIALAAFVAIGIGIAIASLTKDVRTSETLYQTIMIIPAMLTGFISLFAGVPESLGREGLILYLIPWTHATAIFIKISSPALYNLPSQSLTGFGLFGDIIFHLGALAISILIIITIASKIFDRESILN